MGFTDRLWARARLALSNDAVTLSTLARRIGEAHGDRMLISSPDGLSWSALEVFGAVDYASGIIRSQIAAGDRVLVEFPNGPALILGCLAVCAAGGVAVPVNDASTASERAHVNTDSGATLTLTDSTVVDPRSPDPSAPIADLSPSDVAVLLYTSGTTGKPKGAALTHRGLLASTRRLALLPTGLRHDEIVMALPLAHVMGFAGFLSALTSGIPAFVFPKFRPVEVLDVIETRRSSIFVGVPAMYRMLLEAGAAQRDLTSIRVWMSGADAMPADLARQFQRMGASATLPIVGASVGEALFVEGYGMVELSGAAIVKITPPYAGGMLTKARGASLPGVKTRVVNESGTTVRVGQVGELWVTGPGVLDGYFGDKAATSATVTDDGWVRTGDLVRRGIAGTVEFVGRAKDVIKVGGYSVYAAEVQAALEAQPGVAEAAVTGLPDARKGERVAAAVRVRAGIALDGATLVTALSESLAAYKVPSVVVIVDDLPRTTTGKIKRAELRELLKSAERSC
jgi:acyl-CoA synthetase (AMP-forming)/AMP-acid ligase II